MVLLAFMPPGLKDTSSSSSEEEGVGDDDKEEDHRLWGVASRFDDKGDGSISDINALLGSHWF